MRVKLGDILATRSIQSSTGSPGHRTVYGIVVAVGFGPWCDSRVLSWTSSTKKSVRVMWGGSRYDSKPDGRGREDTRADVFCSNFSIYYVNTLSDQIKSGEGVKFIQAYTPSIS